jgi:hypothetical protein
LGLRRTDRWPRRRPERAAPPADTPEAMAIHWAILRQALGEVPVPVAFVS